MSSLGDGVRSVAFPLLAAALTRDPRAVALVSAAGFLPWPLFGLLGGAVVDRVDRRRLMWRTDVVRAIIVGCFALLVADNRAPVAGLAAASFVLGVAETLFDNAASALVPMLVADSAIERANSWLLSSQTVMSVLVGAPVGGALFALATVLPVAFDAVSFAVAAVLVAAVTGSYSARRTGSGQLSTSVWNDIGAGVRWLWGHRLLRTLCLLLAVLNATFAAADAVLVLYALDIVGVSSFGYGVLLAVLAIGGLLGTAIAPVLGRMLGLRTVVVGASLAQAVALLAAGLSSRLVVIVAALALTGAGSMVWNVVTVSLRQRVVPAELLGRVTSSYRVIGFGAMPVGALVGGALAKEYGLRAPYLYGGLLIAAATVACLPLLKQRADS